jgi:ring-opening amidohydrolase-like protein
MDASGMAALIKAGTFAADEVIAVIGKTEGNGGVNDFTRILADQPFRGVLAELGHRSEADIRKIPMIWSGGCDGVLTPHATVFARNARAGPASHSRMAIGTAMSPDDDRPPLLDFDLVQVDQRLRSLLIE